jgi:antirestriction protein ArdC
MKQPVCPQADPCVLLNHWLASQPTAKPLLSGHVKKGEKGCPVVFWKWLDVEDEETHETKRIPFLRYYSVFNVAQCENIPAPTQETILSPEPSPIEAAEEIVANMPHRPEIKKGLDRAFYSPLQDFVGMPAAEQFKTGEEFYSVLFHELTHATGHGSRLNRKGVAGTEGNWSSFGSNPYAKEELVAEMGSAFLCGEAGILQRTIDNSAAYVASWLKRLKDDSKLVVQAAGAAQKAADFILGKHQGEATDETDTASQN